MNSTSEHEVEILKDTKTESNSEWKDRAEIKQENDSHSESSTRDDDQSVEDPLCIYLPVKEEVETLVKQEVDSIPAEKELEEGERGFGCQIMKDEETFIGDDRLSLPELLDESGNKVFKNKSQLNTQENKHKSYICEVCNKSFLQKSSLESHLNTHAENKSFTCTICNRSFSQNPHLITHMIIHTGNRPYNCAVCNKHFSQKSDLVRHLDIHTGYKAYKCDVCNKPFTRKNGLVRHQEVHLGYKPHECDVCHKKFTRKSTLDTHMEIHTGKRSYKCDLCDRSFSHKPSLITHKKSIHKVDMVQESNAC